MRKYFIVLGEDPASSLVEGVASNVPAEAQGMYNGGDLGVQLHCLRRNAEGAELPFRYADPADFEPSMAVGEINAKPSGGPWKFTDTVASQTTAAIPCTATAADLQAAIRAACTTTFPACIVEGAQGGPYTVRRGSNGNIDAPIAVSTDLEPEGSTAKISTRQNGTASKNAIYFVELKGAPPIKDDGTWNALPDAEVTPDVIQAGSGTANKVFSLVWNADAYAGDVTVKFTGDTTAANIGPFKFNATADDIANAFAGHVDAEGNKIEVVQNGPGDYSITCTGPQLGLSNTPDLATLSNTLKVPVGLQGFLASNPSGIYSLLGEEESVTATLEIKIYDGETTETVFLGEVEIFATLLG